MGDMRLISLAIIPPPIIILHLGEAKHHTRLDDNRAG